jgi:hypothetical protein
MKITKAVITKHLKQLLQVQHFEVVKDAEALNLRGRIGDRKFEIEWIMSKERGEDYYICEADVSIKMSFDQIEDLLRPCWPYAQQDYMVPSYMCRIPLDMPPLELIDPEIKVVSRLFGLEGEGALSKMEKGLQTVIKHFSHMVEDLHTIAAVYIEEEPKLYSEQRFNSRLYLAVFTRAAYKALLHTSDFYEYYDYKFGPNSYFKSEYNASQGGTKEDEHILLCLWPKLLVVFAGSALASADVDLRGPYDRQVSWLLNWWENKIESIDDMKWFETLPRRIEKAETEGNADDLLYWKAKLRAYELEYDWAKRQVKLLKDMQAKGEEF